MPQDFDSNNLKHARTSSITDDGHVRKPCDPIIPQRIQSGRKARRRRPDWHSSNKQSLH
jgi:hypothetical protein